MKQRSILSAIISFCIVFSMAFSVLGATFPVDSTVALSTDEISIDVSNTTNYLVWEDFTNPYPNTYSDNIPSSWDAQLPAGGMKYVSTNGIKIAHMVDNSEHAEGILQREFNPVAGSVVWEFTLNASGATDSAVVEMQAGNKTAVRFRMEQGKLKIGETAICTVPSDATLVGIRVVLDTESDTFRVSVDGTSLDSTFEFVEDCDFVNRMYLRTTESNVGTMGLSLVRVYKNLYINEKFLVSTNALPDYWEWNNQGSVDVIQKFGSVAPDVYNLKISNGAIISTDATYVADEAWVEYQFLITENSQPDLVMALTDDQENAFRVGSKASGEKNQFGYYNSNGEFVALYDLLDNQWYHVMVKITAEGGLIYLNHKLKAEGITIPFSKFDTLAFEAGAGEALLDDILLKDYFENDDDYVPEPVLPEEDGYIVGMQACSLWKEGSHFGWDWISDWEERQSLLGLYDEMSSECADWEIKWMVEHSVDFEFFCWYRPPNSVDEPIKQPRNAYALEEAYFNAKYSDLLKFAISWENGSGTPVSGSEDFRENIVTYWIEQYFKDSRYMLVDNKPVVGIYNFAKLKEQFGSIENIKAELDYLEEACIAAGFDGCIVMLTTGETNTSVLQEYKDAGIDCLYAYNWGPAVSVQQEKMLAQKNAAIIDMVPTICMGRDDSAWERTAGSYLTNTEFRTLADWVANTFMPTLDSNSLGSKMVMVGNWNEYGEGHYVMPSNLNGFGYLDTIRAVFGDNETHTDTVPTAAQLERINRMYIQDRVVKRTYTKETSDEIPEDVKIGWYFNSNGDTEGWEIEGGVDALTIANGSMSGNSTDTDPKILSPDALNIAVGDVPYIRVRIKVDPVNATKKLRVYFTTTSSTAWAQTKCLSMEFTGANNEYVEYLFDTSTKTAWTGTLKQLRIDPLEETGSFAIDSIELLQTPSDSEVNVMFEGEQIFTTRPVYIRNEHVMFPAAELSNYITASWCTRIDDSELLLFINEKDYLSVAYNDAQASLNGAAVTVTSGAMNIDGEYYFPLDVLENVGYTVTWDTTAGSIDVCAEEGTGVEDNVTAGWPTEEKDMDIPELPEGLDIVKAWYFDHDADGWDYGGGTAMEWKNGVLYLYDTVSNDPIAYSPAGLGIDTQSVSVIRIRVRTDNPSGKLKLYFTTAANEAMNANKVFKAAYADITPGADGFYTFDIDCKQLSTWTGTLERLRITPASTTGKFFIDSVELLGEDNTTYDAGLKILVIGNSITQHDPSASKGWLANWGMAATCAENDYVHRLLAMAEALDTSVEMKWVNISQFEAYYYDWSKITKDYSEYADFDPDIIISTIGANINNAEPEEDGTYDSGQFFTKEHYKAIIDYFNKDGEAAVLVGTTIWVNGEVEEAIEAAVEAYGYEYVSMNDLTDSQYRATSYKNAMITAGVVSESVSSGVLNHPGDEGMRVIANRLWKKLRPMMIAAIEEGSSSEEGPSMDVPALPEGTEVKHGWYFDENAEGWVSGGTTTAVWENGTIKFNTDGSAGPVLWSGENLNIDLSDVTMVRIRIKVDGTVSGKLKLYFAANGATAVDTTNMVFKPEYASVTPGEDGYYTLDIDCTTNSNWKDILNRLRIDPAGDKAAIYYLDSVELIGAETSGGGDSGEGNTPSMDVPALPEGTEVKHGWYFDENTEGWVAGGTTSVTWENGNVKFGTSNGSGPVIWSSENVDVDLSDVTMVRIRIKVDGDVSGKLKFYFIANGKTAVDTTNMVFKLEYATVTPGADGYYTFDIDCTTNANWAEILHRLRIDPAGNVSAIYYLDSVELLGAATVEDDDTADVPTLPEGTEVKHGWYFDENAEGWVSSGSTTAAWENGTVKFNTDGKAGPVLWSAENLNVDLSDVSMVRIRIKVEGTVSGKLKLYFAANGATTVDTTNMVYKPEYASFTPGTDGYYTIDIDCATNDNWQGMLSRLRIDPAGDKAAIYHLDSVELIGATSNDTESATAGSIKFSAATLNLLDKVCIIYKCEDDRIVTNNDLVAERGVLLYETMALAQTKDPSLAYETIILAWDESQQKYIGQTSGIDARDMDKSQFAVAYVKMTDGTYIFSTKDSVEQIVEYSPLIYCRYMQDDARVGQLCRAMMHYGATAQVLQYGMTTGLMNEGFEAIAFDESVLGDSIMSADTSITNGMKLSAVTMDLKGAISYIVKFTVDESLAEKQLFAEYTLLGKTGTVELTHDSDGRLRATIAGVPAKDLGATIQVKSYYLDENGEKVYGGELVYSGLEYVRSALPYEGYSEEVKAVAKALAMYVYYADLYGNH